MKENYHWIIFFISLFFSRANCSQVMQLKGNRCNAEDPSIDMGTFSINKLDVVSYATLKRNNYLFQVRGGFSPTTASLLAGSFAGAIGVGVAFPLDTLKTKSQVLGRAAADLNMFALIRTVYRKEGIKGFFGGVRGMMAGQALIKAAAFSANTFALKWLQRNLQLISSVAVLMIAAAFAGFVTSFIVAPVERIKVMMQASDSYKNELDCVNAVLRAEGISGLLGRGLNPTILREVPSYCIYFVIYGLLMKSTFFSRLGSLAPCVCGAISGMTSWVPVYPIDAVKTIVQNTEGSGEKSKKGSFYVARKLYEEGGIPAFFDGIIPKMLRAAVNHAVTFSIYEAVMTYFQSI